MGNVCFLQVVFLRNFGVLIAGDTIEEAFLTAVNVMEAVSTQVGLTSSFCPEFISYLMLHF